MANGPSVGARYPVRLGRSMLGAVGGAGGSRAHFGVRFGHLPTNVALASAGTVRRSGDKLFMHLPAGAGKGMRMHGSQLPANASAMSEYLLIFHDGVLYLERLSAVFYKVVPVDGRTCAPPPPADAPPGEPWSPPAAGSSPVTQEDDARSPLPAGGGAPPAATSALPRARAMKGVPGAKRTPARKLGAAGGIAKRASPAAAGGRRSPPRAASKTVAGKALPRNPRPAAPPPAAAPASAQRAANASGSDDSSDDDSSDDDEDSSDGSSSASHSSENSEHFTDASSEED